MPYENFPFNKDMPYKGSYPATQGYNTTKPYAYGMENLNPQPMNPAPSQTMPPLQPSMMTPQLSPPSPFPNSNLQQSQFAGGGLAQRGTEKFREAGNYAYGKAQPYAQGLRNAGNQSASFLEGYAPERFRGMVRPGLSALPGVLGAAFAGPVGGIYGAGLGGAMYGRGDPVYDAGIYGAAGAATEGGMAGAKHLMGYAEGGNVASPEHYMMKPGPWADVRGYAAGGQMPMYAEGGLNDLSEMLEMMHMQQMQAGNPYGNNEEMNRMGDDNKPHYKIGGFLKKAARFALPIAGGLVGGPIGAGLGGALGAGISGHNPIKAGLLSAGLGFVAPALLGTGGFGSTMGMGGLSSLFGGASAASKAGSGANGMGGMLSKLGISKLSDLLLPGAILGTAMAKKEVPKEKQSLAEVLASAKPNWGPEQQARKVMPTERVMRILDEDEDEMMPTYFKDTNPAVKYGASGGSGRYLEGSTGGQDDSIDAKLSDGEFVLSADVVSDLGDGNNKAGAKKLDMFMKSVRKHKDSKRYKNGLPPKAKSLGSYMAGRG